MTLVVLVLVNYAGVYFVLLLSVTLLAMNVSISICVRHVYVAHHMWPRTKADDSTVLW